MTRPNPEQRDTLAARIGTRAWSASIPIERATLVLVNSLGFGLDISHITYVQLAAAMRCMPLKAQAPADWLDMACALGAVLPKIYQRAQEAPCPSP